MVLPRISLIVPLLLSGLFLPAPGEEPARPPTGTLGMVHEGFSHKEVALSCGEGLTMKNSSRWVHIIGPGRGGLLVAAKGVPVVRRKLMETNDIFTTGPWTSPGVQYLTCAVHPEMTVKVVVSACSESASR